MKRLKYYEAAAYLQSMDHIEELSEEQIVDLIQQKFTCAKTEALKALNIFRFQNRQFTGMTTGSINAKK